MSKNNNIYIATMHKKGLIRSFLETAKKFKNDPERKERLNKQECKWCFYMQKIGGTLPSSKKCDFCDNQVHSNSTNINKICISCAKKYKVCKQCCADINLINKNKGWGDE